jgi:hypothetical protein
VRPLFEAWYLVVSGRFWLRYAVDGSDRTLWLVSFDGERAVRKEPIDPGSVTVGDRRWASPWWDLTLEPLAPGFAHVHPLARPLAKTRLTMTAPALLASGRIGEATLDAAPAHQAHLCGTRRPERFGWAHATLPGGRYVDLLAAEVPRLPRLALWATERECRNSPLDLFRNRSEIEPTRVAVGPFVAETDPGDVVGVTYHDPDGRPLYCYHSELARLHGPGLEAENAAFEYACRSMVPGWPISL